MQKIDRWQGILHNFSSNKLAAIDQKNLNSYKTFNILLENNQDNQVNRITGITL